MASQWLAWALAGNKPALVARETQELLMPGPGREEIGTFLCE